MSGRVAIYAAPGSGSSEPAAVLLKERAEAWLGRATDTDTPPRVAPDGWRREEVDAITADARRYGFHGTLKAPFRIADGMAIQDLEDAVDRLADASEAAVIPALTLTRLDGFFALVPGMDAPKLQRLADGAVAALDGFRAPPTDADVARRRPEELTPRRRALFERWGYPYVFEEFRFHLTLTDRIPAEDQASVRTVLVDWFAECLGRPVTVDALAVFVEPEPHAPFRLHSLHPLPTRSDAPEVSEPSPQRGFR